MMDKQLVSKRREHSKVRPGAVAGEDYLEHPVSGKGKCTISGCDCPSYVDPPGGFNCDRLLLYSTLL